MKKTTISSGVPKAAGPYSHGVVANGFLFTAGFGPQDPTTGEVPEGVAAQTAQVLRNVQTVLKAHGVDFEDVVKVTVHLQELHRDFNSFNEVYAEFIPAPHPVRTTVGSQLMNILVEIDVVAALPPAASKE